MTSEQKHIVEALKQRMGYIETPRKCDTCRYFKLQPDNQGHLCKRNPDIAFKTTQFSSCDKWDEKKL